MGLVTSSPKPSFGTAHHHHDLPPRKVKGPFLLQGQGKAEIHSVFMDQTIAFLKSLSPSRYSIWYTGLSMLSGAGVAGESRLPGLQSSGVANALGLRGQGQAGDGASSRWSWLGRLDCRPTPPPPGASRPGVIPRRLLLFPPARCQVPSRPAHGLSHLQASVVLKNRLGPGQHRCCWRRGAGGLCPRDFAHGV